VNCELTQRYVPGYLDGELDLVRTIEMESHLKGCPTCAQEVETLKALRAALHSDLFTRIEQVRRSGEEA
jgi:anti-sigma factor RsiW